MNRRRAGLLSALLMLHAGIQGVAGLSQLGILSTPFSAYNTGALTAWGWLVASATALVAGVLVLLRAAARGPDTRATGASAAWALIAAATSQVLCVVQWDFAKTGTIVNALICLAVIAAWRRHIAAENTTPTAVRSLPTD